MAGRLEFDIRFKRSEAPRDAGRSENAPMRLLVLGDFSGREAGGVSRAGEELAALRIDAVDVDSFDALLERLAPRLDVSLEADAETSLALEFRELDHFHPDALYERVEAFAALRKTRQRLLDPATFEAEAAELGLAPTSGAAGPDGSAPPPGRSPEDDATTVERLLGQQPIQSPDARDRPAVDISRFVQRIVGPHIVPGTHPDQEKVIGSVDAAIGGLMRSLLHDPAFQRLEASWRGLHALVSRLELGEELRLAILDISRDELRQDLTATPGGALDETTVYRLLVDRHGTGTLGGEPWSALVGLWEFGPSEDDVGLLAALAALASRAGGPFLAGATPHLLGCASLATTPDPTTWKQEDEEATEPWLALRRSSFARWIGLALPRVLLRLPYGAGLDEVERFDFDELGADPGHECFLWGNPALACAQLLGQAFQERGWSMEPGDVLDLEDLPAHTYRTDGESHMTPCAEAFLTDRAARAILDSGLMPLLSHRQRNAVRLARFQSISSPAAPLHGPWSR